MYQDCVFFFGPIQDDPRDLCLVETFLASLLQSPIGF